MQSYQTILTKTPDSSAALHALEDLGLQTRDWDLLTQVEGLLSAEQSNLVLAAAHMCRLGEALEAIGHNDAINAYRAAIKKDPDNLGAIHNFARLAELGSDVMIQIEAKRQLARIALDHADAASHLLESAFLWLEKADNPVEALKDLQAALDSDPSHKPTMDAVERLLINAGQFEQLLEIFLRNTSRLSEARDLCGCWFRIAKIQWEHVGDIAAAIHALDNALRADSSHLPSAIMLTSIYEQDRQWKRASELLEHILALANENDLRLETHLKLATLYEHHLNDRNRARQHLEAALAINPSHHDALVQMATWQSQSNDFQAAQKMAMRLSRIAQTPEAKAVSDGCLGRIALRQGRLEEALELLGKNFAILGPKDAFADDYKSLVEKMDAWSSYAQVIQAFIDYAKDSSPLVSKAFHELAWVQQFKLKLRDAATQTLRQGVRYSRGDATLRRTLAQRLVDAGKPDEAVAELTKAIKQQPADVELWQNLARIYRQSGQSTLCRLALQPLLLLDALSAEDHEFLLAFTPRAASAGASALDADAMRRLSVLPQEAEAATELLRATQPGLGKIFPPDFEAYGVGPRDKLSSKDDHPLAILSYRVGAILDVNEFDLYLHGTRTARVDVELGDPALVFIPNELSQLKRPAQAFLVARTFAKMALGLESTEKLTPRELQILLAAATRTVSAEFGYGLSGEEVLEDQNKRIIKALSRKQRKSLEEAAARYAVSPAPDFLQWVASIDQSANRAAALISDDLVCAIDMIRQSRREYRSLEGAALVSQSHEVRDLLRFWLSPLAIDLRRGMGIL
ncbi:MAG: tetratricopeptide repeat protein [Myxococcales bacterium]|nr:MAG: tetratricopeptide repeat protein [Myxococcales bacterium]